jgi:hypothetical protein
MAEGKNNRKDPMSQKRDMGHPDGRIVVAGHLDI